MKVIAVITDPPSIRRYLEGTGYSAAIPEIAPARVHNTLLDLTQCGEICRSKLAGHFVYLHPDPEIGNAQLSRRKEMLAAQSLKSEVSLAMTIEVLLVLVRFPGSRTGDVARRLKGHSPPIELRHVQVVFDRYGLDDVGEKGGPKRR
jgi:hypothetical protein